MAVDSQAPFEQRRDHRRALAIACTLAIHVLLAVGFDMVSVYGKRRAHEPAPSIELVDVELPPPPAPPPAPPAVPPPPAEPPPEAAKAPPPQAPPRAPPTRRTTTAAAPVTSTPTPTSDERDPGGAPTVALPNAPPSARGVAVARGPVAKGPVGRGGSGDGSGAGSGSGAGDQPLSVAMIKTQARPKGDYSYFDARKDYPEEAKRLGIEGKLRVRLTVSEAGVVTAAVLINKLGHGLDEVALAQARRLEFLPAKDTNDRAVSSFVVWTFTFTLPSSP